MSSINHDSTIARQESCPPSPVGYFGSGIDLEAVNRRLEETRERPLRLFNVESFDKVPDFDPDEYYGPRTPIDLTEIDKKTIIVSSSTRIEEAYAGAQSKYNAIKDSGGFAIREVKQLSPRNPLGKSQGGLAFHKLEAMEYEAQLEYQFWTEQHRLWSIFLRRRDASKEPVHSIEQVALLSEFVAYMRSVLENHQKKNDESSFVKPTSDQKVVLKTLPGCIALLGNMIQEQETQGTSDFHKEQTTRAELVVKYKLSISPGRDGNSHHSEEEEESGYEQRRVDTEPDTDIKEPLFPNDDSKHMSDMLLGIGVRGPEENSYATSTSISIPTAPPDDTLDLTGCSMHAGKHLDPESRGSQTPKRKRRSPSPDNYVRRMRTMTARDRQQDEQADRKFSVDDISLENLSMIDSDDGNDDATGFPTIKAITSQPQSFSSSMESIGRTVVFKAVHPAGPASQAESNLLSETERQRYVRLFWDAYLPRGALDGSFPEVCRQYTTCGWIDIARHICVDGGGDDINTSVACLAIVANSLCMLGSRHKERHYMEQGQKVYIQSLQKMRASLATLTASTSTTDLIIASRLLTLFTILWGEEDQSDAWAALNAGELALIVSKPPSAYQTGDEHQLFVDARMHLLIQSLIARKKSVLGEHAWMNEPWAVVAKTPLDRLVDLIAQLPGLAAMERNGQVHLSMIRDYLSTLTAWFEEVGCGMTDLQDESLHARVSKTHTMLIYWTVCLLSRPILLQTLPSDEIPAHVVNVHAIRYNMLKAMRPLFAPEAGWYGVNIALFPLRTLIYTATADDANPLSASEASLLGKIENQVKGREVSGFMSSMGSLLGS